MRALAAPLLLLLCLAGCGDDGKGDFVRNGTYAGSTSSDLAVVLEVGEEVKVNRVEGRFLEHGVIQVGDEEGAHATLTCTYVDDEFEELRCDAEFISADAKSFREVIDLMLL